MIYRFEGVITIPGYSVDSDQFFNTFSKTEGSVAKKQGKISVVACYDALNDIGQPVVHVYAVCKDSVEQVRQAFIDAKYIKEETTTKINS
jgi:hypothetical protein